MGKGIDLAKMAGGGEHAALIDNLKEQLLLVFLRRLGGRVSIPVAEVDDTGGLLLSFNVTDGVFNFELGIKQ
jgi:hypothetical protein